LQKNNRSLPWIWHIGVVWGDAEETRQVLAVKFQAVFPHLDERRRW
jgi:hypothetical protein